MILSCPKEITAHETRVAIIPETAKKFIQNGFPVKIEYDAGKLSGFSNREYEYVGATICSTAKELYKFSDIILKINAPLAEEYKIISPNSTIIANFQNSTFIEDYFWYDKLKLTCFALELIPRISRAQSMDILTSQSSLAGYKAVLDGVNQLSKSVPLMMTAAGTLPPAKILVLGAGVAGLQAIATAKRLGAQVFASDIRPEVKEQIESLGAKFVSSANNDAEPSPLTDTLKQTDLVITTALIPNKTAPILITKALLAEMPDHSIIIDMASAKGGNVEDSQDNKTIIINGVTIMGNSNLAAQIPHPASQLFARNLHNFLSAQYQPETKILDFNFSDEIIKSTCICFKGQPTGVIK